VAKLPRLKPLRERKALTQSELAQKAGVDRSTISRLETDAESAFPTTVRKLAAALGVAPEDLQGGRQTRAAPGTGHASPPFLEHLTADQAARDFLRKHPDVASLVDQAAEQLKRYFPDGRMGLRLLVDPEYGDEGLFLGVSTDLDEGPAYEALERFDQGWWVLNRHPSRASLVIDLAWE
jgi:transcriptional regulator with XRE-family HTH domain